MKDVIAGVGPQLIACVGVVLLLKARPWRWLAPLLRGGRG